MCEPVKTHPADLAIAMLGSAVALAARGLWLVVTTVLAPVAVLLAALGVHSVMHLAQAAYRRWHDAHTPVVLEVVILQRTPRRPAITAARRAIDNRPADHLLWSHLNKEHS